jgi:NAD(P)H-dependent FMN reductase
MKVELIIGSIRPGRVGPEIATWIVDNLPQQSGIDYEIIDIKDWNLPIFDEAIHPSMNQYQHEHTKAWSAKVSEAGAYIWLTPEYNAGYPASLKNAIDYLFHEWQNKPLMIVSYGVGGGITASAQLRQVAERLKMRLTATSPAFVIGKDMSDDKGQIMDINNVFTSYEESLAEASEQLLSIIKNSDTKPE